MAEPLPKKTRKKRHSLLRRVFSETWKETELRSIIFEDAGAGVMTVLLALFFGFAKTDESLELVFLAVGGALCTFFIQFLYRLIFVTPERILNKIEKKGETREAKYREDERGNV